MNAHCAELKKMTTINNTVICESNQPNTNVYGYQICFLDFHPNQTVFSLDFIHHAPLEEYFNENELNTLSFYELEIQSFSVSLPRSNKPVVPSLFKFKIYTNKHHNRDVIDNCLNYHYGQILHVLKNILFTETLTYSPTCSSDLIVEMYLSKQIITTKQEPIKYPSTALMLKQTTRNYAKSQNYLEASNLLICPFVELKENEYRLSDEFTEVDLDYDAKTSNDEAFIDMSLKVPKFLVTNDKKLQICLKDYENAMKIKNQHSDRLQNVHNDEKTVVKALRWVSWMCFALSLSFLFLSFHLYSLLPSLRTVPGINNMLLIVFLFLAQIFLIIGTYVDLPGWLCQVVGGCTHFFWLCVAFTQNVCTFHMFMALVFPIQTRLTMSDQKKTLNRYIAYIITSAVTVVGGLLTWQFLQEGNSGYGGSQQCYIIKAQVRSIMFALPLGLSVLANLVMFVITIISLLVRMSQDSEATVRSHRLSILIYTKLSVLTGVTWLFGFFASFLNSIYLAFPYIVLHGLQGLFIFFAFLANTRTIKLLKEKYRKPMPTGEPSHQTGSSNVHSC